MDERRLTDALWDQLRPILPPQKPETGRPAHDHRTIVEAILWIAETGTPWRRLPERFGSWRTVYSRLRRWQAAGIWDLVLAELQRATPAGDEGSGGNRR